MDVGETPEPETLYADGKSGGRETFIKRHVVAQKAKRSQQQNLKSGRKMPKKLPERKGGKFNHTEYTIPTELVKKTNPCSPYT